MFRKIVFTLLAALLVSAVSVSSVSVDSASAGQEKVTVCHKPGTPAEATLEIAAPALNAHLGHGDHEGECQGPQSEGCTALNALVPDPQMDPYYYYFEVSDLDFFPGETIHVSLTFEAEASTDPVPPGSPPPSAVYGEVAVTGSSSYLALNGDEFPGGSVHTVSLDYVVVAGDDADGASIISETLNGNPHNVLSVNISCTPA